MNSYMTRRVGGWAEARTNYNPKPYCSYSYRDNVDLDHPCFATVAKSMASPHLMKSRWRQSFSY